MSASPIIYSSWAEEWFDKKPRAPGRRGAYIRKEKSADRVAFMEKMMGWGEIYKLTSPSEKTYIGSAKMITGSGKDMRWGGSMIRWTGHLSDVKNADRCAAVNAAIRKYGAENFKVEVLIMCTIEEMYNWENHFMRVFNSMTPSQGGNGYNIRSADQRAPLSEETRARMSEAHLARPHHLRGKHQTEEMRARISATNVAKAIAGRMDYDGSPMPAYMKWTDNIKQVGYEILCHPLKAAKSFTVNKDTNLYSISDPTEVREKKRIECLAYLHGLNQRLADGEVPIKIKKAPRERDTGKFQANDT